MGKTHVVIERVRRAFEPNEYPGDDFLQGSFEGCEPYDEVSPFRGRRDWQGLEADFLDAHANALSFFSEAGFRFFLPAYLTADSSGQLKVADPLFHLTHGFSDITVRVPTKDRVFVVRSGKSALVNPRRYGAATSYDYARYRLSVFTREEASAIVAYLEFKRDHDQDALHKPGIEAALSLFWLKRAQSAPSAESLRRYLAEEADFLAAIGSDTRASHSEQ